MSHCSIHSEPLKRKNRHTAAARFAYQTCSVATDCFRHVDYRRYAPFHVGGGVLLPIGAPAEFANWERFRSAAMSTEKRKDAQEGRVLDFALPRGVDRMLLLPLAAFALLPFVERGMAVRLDVECVEASDGEPNPHAHSWLSQRVLKPHGFGPKERIEWSRLFLYDDGRYVRALIGGRLTLGCAILGIDAYVDPRRNKAKGEGSPEKRRPRWMFRASNEGRKVEAIEQLAKGRELKKKGEATKQDPEPEEGSVIVTNAAMYSVPKKRSGELREKFADAAQKAGYEVYARSDSKALALHGTSVTFAGGKFRIAATGRSEDAAIVARFARELNWPALVVKGGARLADLVAIEAAKEHVFMVNRAPRGPARDLIARAFYSEMKDDIARHDLLGIAAGFYAKFEANQAAPQVAEALDAALQVNVGCDLQMPAKPVVPNTAPARWSNVAEPASIVAVPTATSENEKHVTVGWDDVRRAAAFSSEAIAPTSGDRSEARRPSRVGGPSNPPRSPADLRVPSTAPIVASEVGALASAVAPIASPGNGSRRVATGGDVRRATASSSETIARASGHRREASRLPRLGVASNSPSRSPAGPRALSTAPLRPSEVAGLASTVAAIATLGNDSLHEAAGADARRTAGSSSEPLGGLEMPLQADSWKVKPDPIRSGRDALALEVGFKRQRQIHEELDEFLRRKTGQSPGLRREGAASPRNAKLQQPTRPPQPIPQWPAEIPGLNDEAVETEEPDYQAPRF